MIYDLHRLPLAILSSADAALASEAIERARSRLSSLELQMALAGLAALFERRPELLWARFDHPESSALPVARCNLSEPEGAALPRLGLPLSAQFCLEDLELWARELSASQAQALAGAVFNRRDGAGCLEGFLMSALPPERFREWSVANERSRG